MFPTAQEILNKIRGNAGQQEPPSARALAEQIGIRAPIIPLGNKWKGTLGELPSSLQSLAMKTSTQAVATPPPPKREFVASDIPVPTAQQLIDRQEKISAAPSSRIQQIAERLPTFLKRPFEFVVNDVRDGLFGNPKDRSQLRELERQGMPVNLTTLLKTEGFFPFLGRSQTDQIEHRVLKHEEAGVSPERASELAFYEVFSQGSKMPGTEEARIQAQAKERLAALNPTASEKGTALLATIGQAVGGGLDVAGVFPIGSIKISAAGAEAIARSKNAAEIATIFKREVPKISDEAADVFGKILVSVDNADDVQKVINRTNLSIQEAAKARAAAPVQKTLELTSPAKALAESVGIRVPTKVPVVAPVATAAERARQVAEAPPGVRIAETMPSKVSAVADTSLYNPANKEMNSRFMASKGQEPIVTAQGRNFELGDWGKQHEQVNGEKLDRFPSSELADTLRSSFDSFRSSDNPSLFRSGNTAWISKKDGVFRAVYTRTNARGAEEIVGWHTVSKDIDTYLKNLGVPAEIRTRIASFEGLKSIPLTYRDNIELTTVSPELQPTAKSVVARPPEVGAAKPPVLGEPLPPGLPETKLMPSGEPAAPPEKVPAEPTAQTATQEVARANTKLEKMAADSPNYDSFFERAGVTQEALDKTAQAKGYPDAVTFYDKNHPVFTETDSYQVMAEQAKQSDYALRRSAYEEETFQNDIRETFSALKGVDIKDLDFKFTESDLEAARFNYEITMDALNDHPGRALMKYVSRTTGELPEFTGKATMQSLTGSGKRVATSEWAQHGDDIFQDLVGQELSNGGDVTKAQEFVDDYAKFRKQAKAVFKDMQNIRKEIRLSQQLERFTEEARNVIARKVVRDTRALRMLVENIGKSAYLRGLKDGSKKYKTLVKSLSTRRTQIVAIKKRYNLTDAEMRKIRGNSDPRLMTEREFAGYLADLEDKARARLTWNEERILVDAIIQERDLKKTENLQRAMEFPPMKDMTLEQLTQFGDILAKTEPGDTFLTARMIQTAVNTDLGNIRTIGEGARAIAEQTGMPFTQVEGSEWHSWLRDPTLAERDPLHKMFITEFTVREANMMTKKYQLTEEVTKLAKAARKSRIAADARLRKAGKLKQSLRERIFNKLSPQDRLVVKWLQPFETTYTEDGRKIVTRVPELRVQAEAGMTREELAYARFLEKFFTHYYDIAAGEAATRWTLLGVKHSNYREIYYLHMNRSFFERWKDDGFVKALRVLWSKDVAEAKVDFNAFGDRGEVLGYEKWLNRNMTRRGEGIDKATGQVYYTLNTAKATLAYFHAFERKLILDSMTPKIKLLEFLMGKKFQTPKSITNPEGTEQVHSLLRRHINEWINNKKGQRIKAWYEQGSAIESAVDGTRLLIAVQQLGINIIAQVIQIGGAEVANFAGTGMKGWLKGHGRALTKQGRLIGQAYSGIIGDAPWNELASAANDAGDTLRGGIFYLFGDLAFRARRQMLLGSMTKEEFVAGKLTDKRIAEIKLQMGRWQQMPEFRSVVGSTSVAKAAFMYTEWAIPIIQNAYFVLLPRLRNMIRMTDPKDWKKVAGSKEFQELFRMVIGGAALGATAYLILSPDENDHSNVGYIRRRAAQEISSTIQAVTFWGIPTPFSIMNGYIDSLRTAMGLLVSLERYSTAGPGHAAGDLKAPAAFGKALIPRGIQQWLPAPETPIRTEADIKNEIRTKMKSGELTPAAAKVLAKKELASIQKQQQTRRFTMEQSDYKAELKRLVKDGTMTIAQAKKDAVAYLKQQKTQNPESFDSDSDASFIDKIKVYAEAIGTDPITAFERIFTGQSIRRTDNGAIIVRRMSFEESEAVKKEWGSTTGLILDHTLPLQLGGSNEKNNLKLVPKADWQRYTPIENYLGQLLRAKEIDAKKAKQLILDFKSGEIDEAGVYAATD